MRHRRQRVAVLTVAIRYCALMSRLRQQLSEPEVADCSGLFLCPASLHCNIPSQLDTSLRRRRARIPEKSFEQKVLESPSAARGDLESKERAIALMTKQIEEAANSEAYGILGRIYKERRQGRSGRQSRVRASIFPRRLSNERERPIQRAQSRYAPAPKRRFPIPQ